MSVVLGSLDGVYVYVVTSSGMSKYEMYRYIVLEYILLIYFGRVVREGVVVFVHLCFF